MIGLFENISKNIEGIYKYSMYIVEKKQRELRTYCFMCNLICFRMLYNLDETRSRIHESDPIVKDVCADCNNNRISYIDSYAKDLYQDILFKL